MRSESTGNLEADEQSRGFALRLGIALAAVVIGFVAISGREDEQPSLFVSVVLRLGGPVVWIVLTEIAHRHYERKWRWFLIGAPFAIFELMLLGFTLLASYYESPSN